MALLSRTAAVLWRCYRGQKRYCGAVIADRSATVALFSRKAALLWSCYRGQQRYSGAVIAERSATVALLSRTVAVSNSAAAMHPTIRSFSIIATDASQLATS